MIVSAIVAVAKNGIIGHNNRIPWYLPADLKYFKRTTLGHHVIMGRNCFESIGKPLPQRTNIVISRDPYFAATGCMVAHSMKEALDIAQGNGETEAFIIGGGQIYRQSIPYWDKIYLTEVELIAEGDVSFPEIKSDEWRLLSSETHSADDKNEFDYTFNILERLR